MGTFSYYLAISLDGFLARKDGSVDWLDPFFAKLDSPYDYEAYYETVDALILGRKTFEACITLGKGEYPYPGKPAWVITRNSAYEVTQEGVQLMTGNLRTSISKIIDEYKGRVWLVGGGELAGQLIDEGLIDEIVLTVAPVILGQGLPWAAMVDNETSWQLAETYRADNGLVQLVYRS